METNEKGAPCLCVRAHTHTRTHVHARTHTQYPHFPLPPQILERLFPDMKTNEKGVPCFKGVPFTSSKGDLTSPLPNGWVK